MKKYQQYLDSSLKNPIEKYLFKTWVHSIKLLIERINLKMAKQKNMENMTINMIFFD